MNENMMSADISKLAFALSKFQGNVGSVAKKKTAKVPTKNGGQYEYGYADLADIWSAIRNPLMENELALTQSFVTNGDKTYLQTMLIHSSGQWLKSCIEVDSHVQVYDKGGAVTVRAAKIQELGSEITYLRRYALSSILGIAADEDEDGSAANNKDVHVTNFPKLPKAQLDQITDLVVQIKDLKYLAHLSSCFNVKSLYDIHPLNFNLLVRKLNEKINQSSEVKNESVAI